MVHPTFEVSSALSPKDSVENSPLPINFGKEKLVMNKSAISGETLRQLAVEVGSGNPYTEVDRYRPPSRVEIVLALIRRALVKIDRANEGHPRPVIVCDLIIDFLSYIILVLGSWHENDPTSI